jgi:Ca-activated chloride channel family protein
MTALHFLRPYWFLAIIPWLICCWQINKISLADNWQAACDKHLLAHLLVPSKNKINFPLILLLLGGLLAIFALAGPSFEQQEQPIYRTQVGRIFVLNLSPSMSDSLGSAKKIERARFKLLDFLQRQKEGLTGLIVYTDEAHIISPLTEDSKTIANFVPILDPNIMPTFNDDTVVGLVEAKRLLRQAGINQGSIILVTDKITRFNKAKQIAAGLAEQGYRLFIFDLSGNQSTYSVMQKLAFAGGGKVISLTPNNKDIDRLLAYTKVKRFLEASKTRQTTGIIWKDSGRVFVFLLLLLALFAFRKGYL